MGMKTIVYLIIVATKKKQGGALGNPNKEKNGAKKEQNGTLRGVVFHGKTYSKSKFRS